MSRFCVMEFVSSSLIPVISDGQTHFVTAMLQPLRLVTKHDGVRSKVGLNLERVSKTKKNVVWLFAGSRSHDMGDTVITRTVRKGSF